MCMFTFQELWSNIQLTYTHVIIVHLEVITDFCLSLLSNVSFTIFIIQLGVDFTTGKQPSLRGFIKYLLFQKYTI